MTGHSRVRLNSRGGIFLTLLVIVLASLAILGIYNYRLVERVTLDVGASTLGDNASFTAQSAIDESLAYISQRVNQPGDELFSLFRDQATSSEGFGFTIPVPRTREIIENYSFMDYLLHNESVQAEVLFQKSYGKLPYEKFGTLKLSAIVTARAGFGRRVHRRLDSRHEFKTVLIGPPRPFDQLSFYLHDYRGILNPSEGDQSDNNKIQSSIDDLSTRLPGIRQAYVDILESMKKEWPPETAENIPYDQLEQLFTQPPLEALPSTVPFLFPRDMVLYSQAEALDLDQLHLQKRVRLISAGIQQALVNAKVANLALDACLLLSLKKDIKKNLQKCIILIKPMTLSMVELSKKHTERLNVYRGFQDTFQIATGDQKSKIVKYFYKYKSREKSFWEKKAFYVLDEEKQLDLSKAFEELITRYTPTNGVVFVKNPTKTLRVHSIPQFEGKLVVVTSGKVVLQNISVKSPPQDLLTFISYGKMKLGGSIQASLGPMSEMEIAGTDLRIDGNLVLDRVINPEDLKGVLSYDPRIASGTTSPDSDSNAKKSYYYVGFGPRAIAKSFHRVGD